MNLLLKLKHWQIFLFWIFGAIQFGIFMKTDFWFLSFGLYEFLLLIWIYSVGNVLAKKIQLNTETIKQNNIWWIVFIAATIPFGMQFHYIISESYERMNSLILIICGIVGIISGIKIVAFTAKSLKMQESKKDLKFKDYLVEFILVYAFTIGIWILQSQLNKISTKE